MVYMGGDNNMSSVLEENFMSMQKGVEGFTLLVFVDRDEGEDGIYLVGDGGVTLLKEYEGDVNSGNPNTLVDFVKFVKDGYGTGKYALIIWDHGDGWYSSHSVVFDMGSGSSIGISDGELRRALSSIKEILHKRIDLLIFDACSMGQIEVMGEIYGYADYVIASQGLIPLEGLPYEDVMKTFSQEGDKKEAGIRIVDDFVEFYKEKYPSYNIGISLYRMDRFPSLVKSISSIIEELDIEYLYKKRREIPEYENVDFGEILPDSLLKDFVYYSRYTLREMSGIDIWYPLNYHIFKYHWKEYMNLVFNQKTGWLNFLSSSFPCDILPPSPYIDEYKEKSPYLYFSLELPQFFRELDIYFILFNSLNREFTPEWNGDGFYRDKDRWISTEGGSLFTPEFEINGYGVVNFYLDVETEMDYLDDEKKDIVVVNIRNKEEVMVSDTFYGNAGSFQYSRFFTGESAYIEVSYICERSGSGKGVEVGSPDIKIFSRRFYGEVGERDRIFLSDGVSYLYFYTCDGERKSLLSTPIKVDNSTEFSLTVLLKEDRIEVPMDYVDGNVCIFSLEGRKVKEFMPDYRDGRFIIFPSPLPSGIYFIKIGGKVGRFLWIGRRY